MPENMELIPSTQKRRGVKNHLFLPDYQSQHIHPQREKEIAYLKLLFEALLDCFSCLLSLTNLLQTIIPDLLFQLLDPLKSISCWHEVVVIDQLDEWFYFASFGDSFPAHSSSDFAWISLNTSDESMAKGKGFCAFIKGLEDDGFASCIATTGDKRNLAGFQD